MYSRRRIKVKQKKQTKKKEWTLKPHIGYNYNAPAGKTALTGGLDASYRGMANPKHTANAVVNLGAGYNANSKLGAVLGWDAGYQFHFGAKNRRKGEIKPGKFAGSLMPYAGGNAEDGLMYGGRGEFEWRPKFGNKAPFTVFGGANVNFAPATGKVKEVEEEEEKTRGRGGEVEEKRKKRDENLDHYIFYLLVSFLIFIILFFFIIVSFCNY